MISKSVRIYNKSGLSWYVLSYDGLDLVKVKNERGESISVTVDNISNSIFEVLDKLFKDNC
jgi:hypothetical protein